MQRIDPPRPRWHVRRAALAMAVRAATALIGGYAAAAALATLLARVLPVARVEATLWGMILGVACYAVVGLWSFHEPRVGRVVATVWGIALGAGALVWLLGVRG